MLEIILIVLKIATIVVIVITVLGVFAFFFSFRTTRNLLCICLQFLNKSPAFDVTRKHPITLLLKYVTSFVDDSITLPHYLMLEDIKFFSFSI